jgi:hypothetical protein
MATQQFTLNNGVEMPALGFGVFQTPPEETRAAVEAALSTGYRHIDTAAAYGNERQAGEAVRRSGLDRADVFLETKIWISDYGYDQTLHGFDKSAGKLGVDQIDLLILHQALPSEFTTAHRRTAGHDRRPGHRPPRRPRPRRHHPGNLRQADPRSLTRPTPPSPAQPRHGRSIQDHFTTRRIMR